MRLSVNPANPVFKHRLSSISIRPKRKLEFIDLLIKAAKTSKNLELNIPETLIKSEKFNTKYLIFTTDDGCLFIKDNLKPA